MKRQNRGINNVRTGHLKSIMEQHATFLVGIRHLYSLYPLNLQVSASISQAMPMKMATNPAVIRCLQCMSVCNCIGCEPNPCLACETNTSQRRQWQALKKHALATACIHTTGPAQLLPQALVSVQGQSVSHGSCVMMPRNILL